MRLSINIVIFLSACMLCSCSRDTTKEPEAQPLPKTFTFTETNTVVKAVDIDSGANDGQSLKADFNKDGLNDIAVIRAEETTQNEVDIYIRRSESKSDSAPSGQPSYFKGGTITRPPDGKIKAIASSDKGDYVHIVLMISYPNQEPEWIEYKNNGSAFTETHTQK